MSRPIRLLVGVVTAAVVVLQTAGLGDSQPERGPLRDRNFYEPTQTAGATTGATVFGRRSVTWQSAIVTNPTDRPITLTGVALVDAGSLRILDARAVLRRPDEDIAVSYRWPPTGPRVRPLRGAIVPPRSPTGLQLYLHVGAPRNFLDQAGNPRSATAIASTSGVRVSYEYDNRAFENTISSVALDMCSRRDGCT